MTWENATMMRTVVGLILVLASTVAMAEPIRQTFRDANGREIGRSVSNGRNTVFRDAMGREVGRSVTSGGTTTFFDAMGRRTVTSKGR